MNYYSTYSGADMPNIEILLFYFQSLLKENKNPENFTDQIFDTARFL